MTHHHFLIVPSYHVHPYLLDMSTKKAVHYTRFKGAWKIIKQELLEYIMGLGMPKDAIEWYELVRELHHK